MDIDIGILTQHHKSNFEMFRVILKNCQRRWINKVLGSIKNYFALKKWTCDPIM